MAEPLIRSSPRAQGGMAEGLLEGIGDVVDAIQDVEKELLRGGDTDSAPKKQSSPAMSNTKDVSPPPGRPSAPTRTEREMLATSSIYLDPAAMPSTPRPWTGDSRVPQASPRLGSGGGVGVIAKSPAGGSKAGPRAELLKEGAKKKGSPSIQMSPT